MTFAKFTGRGTTLAEAKTSLARRILAATRAATSDPGFARDDDGAFIVALEREWGTETYRITDAGHKLIATGSADGRTPAEDLARCAHYTVVPERHS
ncbi:hypothetical protein ACFY0Z_30100 [Streptomyces kronopolitis]|uniref:hypothetical protein n=1 Tax=Streptomyces kronopolitis TaxID=1612435 RepID=UPI00368A14D2